MAETLTKDALADFLGDILSDKSENSNSRLAKLVMSTKDNKGTVIFIPLAYKSEGKFYKKLSGVREVKQFTRLNTKVEGECWHRILDKSDYGELTAEEETLYDEVSNKLNLLMNEGVLDWATARWRTYNFFYGYILSHVTEANRTVSDSIDRVALMIYPSNKPIDALATAIDAKTTAAKGKVDWLANYFNHNAEGRQGAISISLSGGQGGYNVQLSFESASIDNPDLIPEGLNLTEAMDKCVDPVRDYLSWQAGEDKLFNEELFLEMNEYVSGYFDEKGNIKSEYLPAEEEEDVDPLG